MRCEHEHDDGPYVLDALSPAERAAYERHLRSCSFCREAVADIAVLPGLLGRLDTADLERLLDPDFPGTAPAPRRRVPTPVPAAPVTTRRRERRRSPWRRVSLTVAAACLALTTGLGALLWDGGAAPVSQAGAPTVAMRPVAGSVPISADVALTATQWGTTVDMVCRWPKRDGAARTYTFRLMAYGPDDVSEQVGSWVAGPGAEVHVTGVTHLAAANLSRLELVRNDGTRMLEYDVP